MLPSVRPVHRGMSNDHLSDPVSRSGTDERDYLLKRAEDHRQLAEITDDRQARTIHLRLRKLYEEQAELVMLVL